MAKPVKEPLCTVRRWRAEPEAAWAEKSPVDGRFAERKRATSFNNLGSSASERPSSRHPSSRCTSLHRAYLQVDPGKTAVAPGAVESRPQPPVHTSRPPGLVQPPLRQGV